MQVGILHITLDHRLVLVELLVICIQLILCVANCIVCIASQLHAEEDLQNLVFPMKSTELEVKHGEIKEKGVDEYK